MPLNQKQREQLLRQINPQRVARDPKGMAHLQAYDVAAHLTRIFGFGNWEKHITSLEMVCEEGVKDGSKTRWTVTYKCQMTLVIKDPSGAVLWTGDDGATGSAQNQPQRGEAHDLALKNAISYALKRCAKDWGDQFGLSLYNKGSMAQLVRATLDLTADEARDVEKDLPDLHPDDDAELAQGEPEAERAVAAQDRAEASQEAPADDPVMQAWAAKIDEITSREDGLGVDEELVKVFREGRLEQPAANAIRAAIKAKVESLPQREMAGAR